MSRGGTFVDFEVARAAWAPVEVTLAEFREFVEHAGANDADLKAHARDLFIACACAARKPGAVEAFEREYGGEIEAGCRRIGSLASSHEDARQCVLTRLFAGEHPKIGEYRARGPLSAWLRVITLRTLLNLRRTSRDKAFDTDAELDALTASDDPELELIKRTYTNEFREVLASSVRELDIKQRTLLRLAFVEGLTVAVIGELYQVHGATASRWIRAAHEQLAKHVRARLRARFTSSEVDDFAQIVVSALDTSLSKYLT